MDGFDLFSGLLGEGFVTALAPCTLVLLVLGLAVTLASEEFAVRAVAAFSATTSIMAWARFAGHIGDANRLAMAVALALAVAAIALRPIRRDDWVALAAGAATGWVSASLWLPCVGEAFGSLLTQLPDRGPSGLAFLTVYLVGALSPLLLFAAVHHLIPDGLLGRLEPVWSVIGLIALGSVAVAVLFGVHDTVIGYLFRWSV